MLLSFNFKQHLAIFSQQPESMTGFGRGIERETLRVKENGKLSLNRHPYSFGSALCHSTITTDFAESLLEFITPVAKSTGQLFDYLNDIHHYVAKNLGDESLWPMSMPCYIENEAEVELAQYGTSNIGKMKTTYRQGLQNRYGSMMQIISGVHYNFSLPEAFWDSWAIAQQSPLSGKEAQSAGYMGLIRNYLRYGWVIPYLFGASPAICKSFLQGKESGFDFIETGKGTIYLPYATSLRLSDLGYTNNEQSSLNICYNSLDGYLSSVRDALNKKSPEFAELGIKNDDQYIQLNDNLLQIENELYASIRAKRVQQGQETPSQALNARGIEYIEIRSLDVNPFCKLGITLEQVNFLDLFLTWCAMIPSPELTPSQYQQCSDNFTQIVTNGREPNLMLDIADKKQDVAAWGQWLTEQLKDLAIELDKTVDNQNYLEAIEHIAPRFAAPELTSSARILKMINDGGIDNGTLAISLAKTYKEQLIVQDYNIYSDAFFEQEKLVSLQKQEQIESNDTLNFDDFLQDYFTNAKMK
ncbi:MAG: glutamate--cysteine ligase [Psychromonas sp.]